GERELANVFPVNRDDVERNEREGASPPHEIDEDRAAVAVELYDLAIENRVVGVHLERHDRGEVGETLKAVSLPRDERGSTAAHVGERAPAVPFQLKQPIAMVEGITPAHERHRLVSWGKRFHRGNYDDRPTCRRRRRSQREETDRRLSRPEQAVPRRG